LQFGAHVVTLEPPDTFILRVVGELDEPQVAEVLDEFERFTEGRARAYLLIDLSRMGHLTPEARRLAAVRQLPPAYGGLVLFGGTFQQQLVARLATMAGWFLRGRALGKPRPVTAKDEEAARAWVEEQRAR
jgi:hypothetical protein